MRFSVEKQVDKLGRIVLPKIMRDYYGILLCDTVSVVATEIVILITRKDTADTPDAKALSEKSKEQE